MKILKTNFNGYDTYIYNTDKYTTIHLELYFKTNYTREKLYLFKLLSLYVVQTNKKYKTREELMEISEKLYSFYYSMNIFSYSDDLIIKMSVSLIDPKLVKDEYFKELMDTIKTLIFEPNFENGKLDKDILDMCKNTLIGNFESSHSNKNTIIKEKFLLNTFPNTFYTRNIFTDEEFKKIINSFSDQELINAYNDLLDNCFSTLILMGNLSDDYLNIIKNSLKFKNSQKMNLKYTVPEIKPLRPLVIENYDIKESIIYVYYKVKNYNKKDSIILMAINNMLNYVGRILHTTLREELKLVYVASSSVNHYNGDLTVRGNIDSKNKDNFLDGLDVVFNKLRDEKIVNNALNLCIKHLEKLLFIMDENKWNITDEIERIKIYNDLSLKKIYEETKKLDAKDITDFIDRFERKVIYFAKGNDHE